MSPSLPLEIWVLVFFQNTDPLHLYTMGRKVCSSWRTEIPKVIAKKYLEDPNMVQIHSDCETSCFRRFACLLGSELGFSHYKGKNRAVFKPLYEAGEVYHEDECTTRYIRARNSNSQSVESFRLPVAHDHRRYIEKVNENYVGLPPCQIRIKWDANDTELPGLEVDFDKAEISFLWEPMLERFYREFAVLNRRDHYIAAEAMRWLNKGDRSMAAILVRTWKDRGTRENHRMALRQERIKDWYRDMHNHEHSGCFDEYSEDESLRAFRGLEWPHRQTRHCAEDMDEVKVWESRCEAQDILRRMEIIIQNQQILHGNEDSFVLTNYWDHLSAQVFSANTPAKDQRLEQQILSLHNEHLQASWPSMIEDPTDDGHAVVGCVESPSAKAERKRRYVSNWLGRSRM